MRRPVERMVTRWSLLLPRAACACALFVAACAPAGRVAPRPPASLEVRPREAAFPPRPKGALTGSRFLDSIRGVDELGRERAIVREIVNGNVPGYLRRLARVDFRAKTRSGRTRSVTLWVTPDYLSIGGDDDSVRVPMGPISAQLIADRLGFVLPTAKIVNIIYRSAAIKLAPRSLPPSVWMVRSEQFARHDAMIDKQLGGRPPRGLVAGHKKDVVLSNRLDERPHRVAIYGWHELDGHPIQSLSIVHGDWYCDYSHGIRLVAGTMLIDGARYRVEETLRHPDLAYLLSDEGPLHSARYRTVDGPGKTKWWPAIPNDNPPPHSVSWTGRNRS